MKQPLLAPAGQLPLRCEHHRLTQPTVSIGWALAVCLLVTFHSAGCRAIGKFGESRQSIAARKISRQGLKAMRQGDWQIAETLFSEALDISDSNDAAHRGLSESLWQRGRTEAAIGHLERAVELSAGDPKHLQRLGRMYLDVGRVEEASQQCLAALANDRDSAALWALWGDCTSASGRDDEALGAYHRALSLQPDYPHAQLAIAEIYQRQKRYDRLLATLDRLRDDSTGAGPSIDSPPTPPGRADLLRGIAMRELGRTGEATRYFQLAAQKNPSDPAPRMQLASLAMSDGQPDVAQAWLAEATGAERLASELPSQPIYVLPDDVTIPDYVATRKSP